MNDIEEMLKKAVELGCIKAYAITGNKVEMRINGSTIYTVTSGVTSILHDMDAENFPLSNNQAIEDSDAPKPRRRNKRSTE